MAPSPGWMTRRLETIGITPINNVVDQAITFNGMRTALAHIRLCQTEGP